MAYKTTDKFIRGVKRRVMYPSAQRTLKDTDVLEIADDIIEAELLPLILRSNQDYLITHEDEAIESGRSKYSIPTRSATRGIKDLRWFSDGENSTRNLSLISPEDRHYFETSSSEPRAFFFEGDSIVLVPTPSTSSGFIRKWYPVKPNGLCLVNQAGSISSISGDTVTLNSAPQGIIIGSKVDLIRGTPGYSTLAMDLVVENISGTQYTFASGTIPENLSKGDYLAPSNLAPVIQVPDVCYLYLELKTSASVAEILEDFEAASRIKKEDLPNAERDLKSALEPRISGALSKVVNRNGLLRQSGYRRLTI